MRYWRLAAALLVVLGAGVWMAAPSSVGAILAEAVPRLYLIVLALASLGFVGVEAALVWRRGRAARRWDGWGVESAWSIVPAAILASLVLYQASRVRVAADHPQQENLRTWPIDSAGREPQP